MKYITMLFVALALAACSENASDAKTEEVSSSSLVTKSSSSIGELLSSSAEPLDSFRLWLLEYPLQPISVRFNMDERLWDTVWLECKFKNDQSNSILRYSGFLSPSFGDGDFDLPDSTFQRGDTIHYRLAYSLKGKLDSTEWQEYAFLGNHLILPTPTKIDTIIQFDSIERPIILGKDDSCGKAVLSFIYTYSIIDTFDYAANRDAIFSNGRTLIEPYNQWCKNLANPILGKLYYISYEGDINEAAKDIQKINPVFFLNLTPYCEEYYECPEMTYM